MKTFFVRKLPVATDERPVFSNAYGGISVFVIVRRQYRKGIAPK